MQEELKQKQKIREISWFLGVIPHFIPQECMWLIFAPSEGRRQAAEGRQANAQFPDRARAYEADKMATYEAGRTDSPAGKKRHWPSNFRLNRWTQTGYVQKPHRNQLGHCKGENESRAAPFRRATGCRGAFASSASAYKPGINLGSF